MAALQGGAGVSGNRRTEDSFFAVLAIAMTFVVFVGFSRTFFLRAWFPEAVARAPGEAIFYVHGALFSAWMALFIAQILLIRSRRLEIHRRLGAFGGALAVAMVVTGVIGALVAARRPGGFFGVPLPPQRFLVVPLTDMLMFGSLVTLAICWRARSASHKRLMVIASAILLTPAVARIQTAVTGAGGPILGFVVADLFVLALAFWDWRTLRRIHPVTLWAGLLLMVSQPLRLWFAGTHAWQQVAAYLMGAPS
ncbi:MAG: hypothetical protein R3E86_11710 [Pseudomonadales bacterium]